MYIYGICVYVYGVVYIFNIIIKTHTIFDKCSLTIE